MTEPATCLGEIDVVILAGGLGTRIRDSLGDTPKILAPIAGKPFVDILLARLSHFGAKRVVLGLGYLGEKVVAHLEGDNHQGLEIDSVIEAEPLGTAGALRFLSSHIASDPVMVMNGDSFFAADLCDFVQAHEKSAAIASVLCAQIDDTTRYGRLRLSPKGRVEAFLEKDPDQGGAGPINAGIYLFSTAMMEKINTMEGPSLERDIFGALPPETLNAVTGNGPFIDIGTPDDLARAPEVLKPYL